MQPRPLLRERGRGVDSVRLRHVQTKRSQARTPTRIRVCRVLPSFCIDAHDPISLASLGRCSRWVSGFLRNVAAARRGLCFLRPQYQRIPGRSVSAAVIFWWSPDCELTADATSPCSGCRVHWIRGRLAGNQARAAAEREVFKSPLNENNHAALKFHNVDQVDKEPDQPRGQPRYVKAENVGHGRRAADDGHIALIEIVERRQFRLAFQARPDSLCRVGASLHRYLRDAGQLLPFLVHGQGEIADDENVWIRRDSEVAVDLDSAAAIRFRLGALREPAPKWRRHNTAGPKHGPRW